MKKIPAYTIIIFERYLIIETNVIRAYDQQTCLDEELYFVRSLNKISNLGHDHIFVWYPALIKLTS